MAVIQQSPRQEKYRSGKHRVNDWRIIQERVGDRSAHGPTRRAGSAELAEGDGRKGKEKSVGDLQWGKGRIHAVLYRRELPHGRMDSFRPARRKCGRRSDSLKRWILERKKRRKTWTQKELTSGGGHKGFNTGTFNARNKKNELASARPGREGH